MSATDDGVFAAVHIETFIILILCAAGITGHIVSICVLYSMLNPNNLFLISMSCSQLALCANFFYSSLFKYLSDVSCISQLWSYAWVSTLLVSVNVSVVVHMSGVFHVVALSIIRFISLKRLVQIQCARPWFSYEKCLRTIVLINISVVLICTPFFFNSEVREVPSHEECSARFPEISNFSAHELSFTVLAMHTALGRVNFWLLGTICKLIPCAVLVVMTVLLIQKLRQIQLMSIRFTSPTREKKHRRTTHIILIIMVLFVVVELPQGVISILSSLTGAVFAESESIGDLFDVFSLLNSCVTFGLFCSMNSRIRNALTQGMFPFNQKRFQQIAYRCRHRTMSAKNRNLDKIRLDPLRSKTFSRNNGDVDL